MNASIIQMTGGVFILYLMGLLILLFTIGRVIYYVYKACKTGGAYTNLFDAYLCVILSVVLFFLIVRWAIPTAIQNHSRNFVDEFIKEKVYYEVIYNSGELDTFSKQSEYDNTVEQYNRQLDYAFGLERDIFTENMDSRIYNLEPIKTFE